MLSPRSFGQFAAETNIRLQKAFLISFSIALFIALRGDVINDIVGLMYDRGERDSVFLEKDAKTDLIVFAQYLMVYVIVVYSFNYVFASLSYFFKYYRWRSIYSLGLFPIGKIIIDWVIPVGFAFYVLYTINQSDACNGCMLGQDDKIANDFAKFWDWIVSYFGEKKDMIYIFIKPVADIYVDHIFPFVTSMIDNILHIIWKFVALLLSPFVQMTWESAMNTFLASIKVFWDLIMVILSTALDLPEIQGAGQANSPTGSASPFCFDPCGVAPNEGPINDVLPEVYLPSDTQEKSSEPGFFCSYLGWMVSWSSACLAP